jgi:hypothetical protein
MSPSTSSGAVILKSMKACRPEAVFVEYGASLLGASFECPVTNCRDVLQIRDRRYGRTNLAMYGPEWAKS